MTQAEHCKSFEACLRLGHCQALCNAIKSASPGQSCNHSRVHNNVGNGKPPAVWQSGLGRNRGSCIAGGVQHVTGVFRGHSLQGSMLVWVVIGV